MVVTLPTPVVPKVNLSPTAQPEPPPLECNEIALVFLLTELICNDPDEMERDQLPSVRPWNVALPEPSINDPIACHEAVLNSTAPNFTPYPTIACRAPTVRGFSGSAVEINAAAVP